MKEERIAPGVFPYQSWDTIVRGALENVDAPEYSFSYGYDPELSQVCFGIRNDAKAETLCNIVSSNRVGQKGYPMVDASDYMVTRIVVIRDALAAADFADGLQLFGLEEACKRWAANSARFN